MSSKRNKVRSVERKLTMPTDESVIGMRLHSGPIPSPDVLRQYKALHPDLPEKIFAMAQKEQEHRHALDMQQMHLVHKKMDELIEVDQMNHAFAKRGQNMTVALVVLYLFVLTILAFLGFENAVSVGLGGASIAALGGIAGLLIFRKFKSKTN